MRKTYYSHAIFTFLCMFACTLGPIGLQAKDQAKDQAKNQDEYMLIERIKKHPRVLANYDHYWYDLLKTFQIQRESGILMSYEDLYKLLKEKELAPIRAEVRKKVWKNLFFLFVSVVLSGVAVKAVGVPAFKFLKGFLCNIMGWNVAEGGENNLFDVQIASIAAFLGPLLGKVIPAWGEDAVKGQLEAWRDFFTTNIGKTGVQFIQFVGVAGALTYMLPYLKSWFVLVKESFVLFCYDWNLLGYRKEFTYNPMEGIEKEFIAAWHFLTYEQIASCIEYLMEVRKDPTFLPYAEENIRICICNSSPKKRIPFDHGSLMHDLKNYPPEMQEVARHLLLNLAIKSQQVGSNSASTDFVLLVGPPGTGKTEFVRIIADIAGAYLAQMSYTGLKDSDIEGVAGSVRDRKPSIYATLFAQNEGKPIILLIDDMHAGIGTHGKLDNMKHILSATSSSCLQQGRAFLIDHAIPGGVPKPHLVFATVNSLELVPPELRSRALVLHVAPNKERMATAFYEVIFPRLLANYSKAAIGPFGVSFQDFTEEELAAIPEKAKDFRELDRLAVSLVLSKIEREILKADGVNVINQLSAVAVT